MDKELNCGCFAFVKKQNDYFWIHSLIQCCRKHNKYWFRGKFFKDMNELTINQHVGMER